MVIEVRTEEEGLPLLELLQRRIPAAPPSYLRQLLRGGKVRREGEPSGAPLAAGERLRLPESARLRRLLEEGEEVRILYESREILAVYKGAGVAVHRGVGHEDNLARRVERLMERRGAPFRTAPVHRLDAETSGPVLFAKGKKAAGALGRLFMAGEVEKVYLGLAAGRLSGRGRLDAPVPAKGKLKEADTEYAALAGTGAFTFLELRLVSGRTHQIRRQLADEGHPLAGDRRYGGARLEGLDRLFLHCRRLAFTDPFSGASVELDAPLPPELAAVLRTLGLAPVEGSP